MSWSVSIPAGPVADFAVSVDKALAEAHVERQNPEGVKAAEYAVATAKQIVAAGVLGIGEGKLIQGHLGGHAGNGLDSLSISLGAVWPTSGG